MASGTPLHPQARAQESIDKVVQHGSTPDTKHWPLLVVQSIYVTMWEGGLGGVAMAGVLQQKRVALIRATAFRPLGRGTLF